VGLRAVLDTEATGKSFVAAGDRTPVNQSVLGHYAEISQLLNTVTYISNTYNSNKSSKIIIYTK
jgi:hypothetical protein